MSVTTYDNRPLPIGGSRIPEGMEEHSDWKSLPEQEVKSIPSITYGSDYVEAERTRNLLGDLKKAISAILPPIAAIDRNSQLATSVSSEEKRAEIVRLNSGEEKRRDDAIAALRLLLSNFPSDGRWAAVIVEVSDRAAAYEPMSREEFIKFNDFIKVQTAIIFREQGALLQKMKDIKKRQKQT